MNSAEKRPVDESDSSDLVQLQDLLDAVPAPFEPLDASALDGYLCGVLLQPVTIPLSRWMRYVIDIEGREALGIDVGTLQQQVQRRHAELDRAIARRSWFDPWVFEPEEEEAPPSAAVAPWVAGFAVAVEHFPALTALDAASLTEPLALLYRHLDADDLEDADELLAEIETLEPPTDLAEAVEDLVRATLLLADVSRPMKSTKPSSRPSAGRKSARGRRH